MLIYYMDRFEEAPCAGVECALSLARKRGCTPTRICQWGSVVEVQCAEGPTLKLLPTPQDLEQYYRHEREAACWRPQETN